MSSFSDRLLDELRAAERRRAARRAPGWARPRLVLAAAGALAVAAAVVVLVAALGGAGDRADERAAGPVLPKLGPDGVCPIDRRMKLIKDFGGASGPGPVYPVGSGTLLEVDPQDTIDGAGEAWYGAKTLWVAAPSVKGDVVVTGRRIDGKPGEVRFDAGGDHQALKRLVLLKPQAGLYAGTPNATLVNHTGCYAWIARGPGVNLALAFRAVYVAHRNKAGNRYAWVRAVDLERGIVNPRDPHSPPPDSADCRQASSAERRSFGRTTLPVFVCLVDDTAFVVLVLPNGCYTAHELHGSRGLQACADGLKRP